MIPQQFCCKKCVSIGILTCDSINLVEKSQRKYTRHSERHTKCLVNKPLRNFKFALNQNQLEEMKTI